MLPKRDLAIVLRSVPYGERDRIITALTLENGQISALAKNSIQSRRFGGSLDLFAASDWTFTTRASSELVHLVEAQIREPFEKLRNHFTLFSVACAFNEFVLKMAPGPEASSELFRLHSNALSALNLPAVALPDSQAGYEIAFLNTYLGKLLQWNGNQPQLHSCLHCSIGLTQLGLSEELSCILPMAGWICSSCRLKSTQHSSLRVAPIAVLDLQNSLGIPIRQTFARFRGSVENHRELFKFLEALYIYHVPGFDRQALKTLRFLDLESNLRPEAKNRLQTQPVHF